MNKPLCCSVLSISILVLSETKRDQQNKQTQEWKTKNEISPQIIQNSCWQDSINSYPIHLCTDMLTTFQFKNIWMIRIIEIKKHKLNCSCLKRSLWLITAGAGTGNRPDKANSNVTQPCCTAAPPALYLTFL